MSEGMMTGEAVYVQTIERENQVVVFVRAADGTLAGQAGVPSRGDGGDEWVRVPHQKTLGAQQVPRQLKLTKRFARRHFDSDG
jgi:hypothetical protein